MIKVNKRKIRKLKRRKNQERYTLKANNNVNKIQRTKIKVTSKHKNFSRGKI